jgi:tRNA(Arg) A34 adenosine deaminase TadA
MTLTNKYDSFRGRLVDLASKSVMGSKHGAILLKHNKVVATAFNTICGNQSCHAECNVIKTFLRSNGIFISNTEIDALEKNQTDTRHRMQNATKGGIVLVVRASGDKLMSSKPCVQCCHLLRAFKIKAVVYSDDNKLFYEKTHDIETDFISSARRGYKSIHRMPDSAESL